MDNAGEIKGFKYNGIRFPFAFLLDSFANSSYTLGNTAATPLSFCIESNAQPWWLFYACRLGVLNA